MGRCGAERFGERGRRRLGDDRAVSDSVRRPACSREAGHADIDEAVEAFARAARMSDLAGYEAVEIHAAHGYLVHQFLSPLQPSDG
ncbi:hypothetical protein NKH77_52560 [Streptomyces sp. M19]